MSHNTKTWPAECSRAEQVSIPVTSDRDILRARQCARELASEANFTALESTFIATAVSELARNILQYAGRGEIMLRSLQQENRTGVMVVARDKGPGISDLERALQDAFSTSDGLGLGLPGVRRMMDEFEIVSHQNLGTTVIVKKWAHKCTTGGPGSTSTASFERRDAGTAGRPSAVALATGPAGG
jgi:serine/threonine-protein kinase RsbT